MIDKPDTFFIRGLTPELKQACILRAAVEGRSLSAVIRAHLEVYGQGLADVLRERATKEEEGK